MRRLEEDSTVDPQVQAIVTEYMKLLTPGLPRPEIRMVERLGARWLGQCYYRVGDPTTLISLQRFIAGDEQTLRRVLAHELCHHDDLISGWEEAAAKGWSPGAYLMDREMERKGHGAAWRAIAAEFNKRYGANFVTTTSDESYAKQEASREAYMLLWQNGARLMWVVAVRLSPRQRTYIARKLAGPDGGSMRLVKTRDVDLIQGGARPGEGFAFSRDPAINEKLLRAWNEGKPVQLAEDRGRRWA